MIDISAIPPDRPVLLAGPTASGKSGLAARIAERQGGVIVNADALQVFDGWRLLTARPSAAEMAALPHALYGHVPFDAAYSAGQWLADVAPLLHGGPRPIIVGGTGLNFMALTEGLAAIPPVPPAVRAAADDLPLAALLAGIDPATLDRIDRQNRARVQRAWEVQTATGQGLAAWQAATPPPLLPLSAATALVIDAAPAVLNGRIAARFDAMLRDGLLEEAAAMRPHWNPRHLSSKAIGAAEIIAHLDGQLTLDGVRLAIETATRQYAKRQRTWCRAHMKDWQVVRP